MDDNERKPYDREWQTERGMPPRSRLRIGLTKEGGEPIRFVVQLEYRHSGTWLAVARSDHDRDGSTYRNVELAGLHVDLYHPVLGQFAKYTISEPLPQKEAMGDAEDYIRKRSQDLVRRFEAWL